LLAGVVYEEEVLPADSIPAAGHDLRVHAVATPAGLRCI
jgi:5-formyltetrahydrofolate cyclo-ligase